MDYRFSVLLSVYYKEGPDYLKEALKSITDNQLLKPNEIVLVKDGPLTKELDKVIDEYLEKYPKLFKIVALEKNFGLGKALNIGLENCSYELVARMDGDDIAKSERFLEEINTFKKDPELTIVGSWVDEFIEKDGIKESKTIRKVPETSEEIYEKLKFICAFNHPTVMYKKSKVQEVGSYVQDFALEDYYLWIRLAIAGNKMYNIPKSLLFFRTTEDTARRRGGWKLFKSDIKFQKLLYKIGYLNLYEYIRNSVAYGVYRLIPSSLRGYLQKTKLREKKK